MYSNFLEFTPPLPKRFTNSAPTPLLFHLSTFIVTLSGHLLWSHKRGHLYLQARTSVRQVGSARRQGCGCSHCPQQTTVHELPHVRSVPQGHRKWPWSGQRSSQRRNVSFHPRSLSRVSARNLGTFRPSYFIFVVLGRSGAINPSFDKNKALVDIKIGVSLQATLKLQLSAVSSFMDS